MNPFKLFISVMFFSSLIFAYQDSDIDGVEDSLDRCPNSSFDETVDERGCAPGQHYYGALTLLIGNDISFDSISDTSTHFNFYANYRYSNWDLSISNAATSTTYDTSGSFLSDTGNLYLSTGYFIEKSSFLSKISLGMMIPSSSNSNDKSKGKGAHETDNSHDGRKNDYFTSLYFSYAITKRQNLFLNYRYTISGDSKEKDFENYSTYSIGSGYALSSKWYSALSYEQSGSHQPCVDHFKTLSWLNSYSFSKQFFATLNYAHGLNDSTPDHTISLKFGVRFE